MKIKYENVIENAENIIKFYSDNAKDYKIYIASSGLDYNYCAEINRGILRYVIDSEPALLVCPSELARNSVNKVVLQSRNKHSSIYVTNKNYNNSSIEVGIDFEGLNFLVMNVDDCIIDVFNINMRESVLTK